MEVWHYALIIVLLQLCSAFFSASETAITTASRARLHQLGQEGNRHARMARLIRGQKEKLLGTLLACNTLAKTATAVMAILMLNDVFHSSSYGITLLAILLTSLSLLVFSEMLPKTLALHHAVPMTLLSSRPLRLLMWLLSPLTTCLLLVVRGILILLRVSPDEIVLTSGIDDLKGAIDLHRGPYEDVAQERAMLRSILELSNVEVKSVMTHRRNLDTIDITRPVPQIVREALETGYTRIPLWKGSPENVTGVLHTKALLREIHKANGNPDLVDIARIATRPWFIPASTNLLEQLQAFRARREHFALVVDEYGVLQGVVTLEDILEEIVGDIGDETDSDLPGVIRQPNGSFLVDGSVTLRDVNRQFEWRLPESEAATVAGLVLHEARRVPEVGQVFEFHGFRFEILRRQRNQLTQMRVWPVKKNADSAL